jgi:hypothetical protein
MSEWTGAAMRVQSDRRGILRFRGVTTETGDHPPKGLLLV